MSSAPVITVTGSDPTFVLTVRIGGWAEVTKIADQAECKLTSERIGWFTKRFRVRGSEAEINRFVRLIWGSDLLGLQFRTELRASANG